MKRAENIQGCCESFTQHINRKCKDHGFECPDNVLRVYISSTGRVDFGLQHPLDPSYYKIKFCPWCGSHLSLVARRAIDRS